MAERRRGGFQLNVVISLTQRGMLIRLADLWGMTRQETVRKLITDATKGATDADPDHQPDTGLDAAPNIGGPGTHDGTSGDDPAGISVSDGSNPLLTDNPQLAERLRELEQRGNEKFPGIFPEPLIGAVEPTFDDIEHIA